MMMLYQNHPLKMSPLIQPLTAQAWTLIVLLGFTTVLALLLHVSKILLVLFPLLSLLVGVVLYTSFPAQYVAYNWWIWFLSPMISRIVEQQNGLTQDGFKAIILTPYLVTSLCGICLLGNGKLFRRDDAPFLIAIAAIFYALVISLIVKHPLAQVLQGFLRWSPGICLGLYFSKNWRRYPEFAAITQTTFFWGTLIMGSYGIIQYIYAPSWDVYWWNISPNLQMSIGWPTPYKLRIWSTLNTPMVFSVTMIAGLAISFAKRTKFSYVTLPLGVTALLLSDVRAAWGAAVIGLFVLLTVAGRKMKSRISFNIIFSSLASAVLILGTPLFTSILTRFETFNDIQNDGSLMGRQELYLNYFDQTVNNFVGNGIGAAGLVDAGLLEPLSILGWAGCIPFTVGVVLIFYSLIRCAQPYNDDFSKAAAAAALGVFITILSNNMFTLLPGVLFWGLSSLAIAGLKYNTLRCALDVLQEDV
jgi:hypothetical protein